jgi:hypothetical protein
MFAKKASKAQQPDKTPYTVYNPHSNYEDRPNRWVQDYYQIVSIDPAIKNYCIRIERRYTNGKIIPIVYDKTNLIPNPDKKSKEKNQIENLKSDPNVQKAEVTLYETLTNYLENFSSHYLESHFVVIERQLPHNYKAVRISQHSLSYFFLKLRDVHLLPIVIEVDSKLKSRALGCPKGLNDRQNKAWLIQKAIQLLEMRQDHYSLSILTKIRKKDDYADTVCQIEALFVTLDLPPTIPIPKKITLVIRKK